MREIFTICLYSMGGRICGADIHNEFGLCGKHLSIIDKAGDPKSGAWCSKPRCPNGPATHQRRMSCIDVLRREVDGSLHLGPDAPTVTHANGAMESADRYACTSIDPLVLLRMAEVQKLGDDKYGRDNWRLIPERAHIDHALAHLYAYLAGDQTDDHLGHALVRLEFAMAKVLRPDFQGEASLRMITVTVEEEDDGASV